MMNISICTLIFITFFSLKTSKSKVLDFRFTDGIYTGSSQAKYTDEPYVGTVTIEIENHQIVKAEFQISDTLKHEVFGSDYDKHFPDNVLYREQCHNDWKGVQMYPVKLMEKQNIDSVDAISGATWSYNIFNASVHKALNKYKPVNTI
jgi:major membrane immunogen (membrane-anchored lipoprotein)